MRLRGIILAASVAASVAATGGCGSGDSGVAPETARAVRSVGDSAAAALGSTLMAHLQRALRESGPAGSVEFCGARALALTDSVAEALGRGIALKRTSLRFRNPSNAPDAQETAALAWFRQQAEETGELPAYHVQRGGDTYRYYRPLTVAPPCLTCHGPEAGIPAEVREALAARYPDDRATGYEVGDFRGVIRVSVPALALPGPARASADE